MIEVCHDCGRGACSFTLVRDKQAGKIISLCNECFDKREKDKLMEKAASVSKCSDFKEWSGRDLSELFWVHLGIYQKDPNPKSYKIIEMAYRWACHADHGLSNSFRHAMKWAGIDILTEYKRWTK